MTADTLTLPAAADSVPQARRFIRQQLVALGADGACDDAETLISELATNAVLHAKTEYTIRVARTDGRVRIRVHDLSSVLPRERHYGPDSTTGRGIRLVATLAVNWGVESEGTGKAIWFELAVDGGHLVSPDWDDDVDIDALLDTYDEEPTELAEPGPQAQARAA